MTKQPTIVITGTAGFIGSVMVQYLNENGLTDLLLVDDFGVEEKRRNLGIHWRICIFTFERVTKLEQNQSINADVNQNRYEQFNH